MSVRAQLRRVGQSFRQQGFGPTSIERSARPDVQQIAGTGAAARAQGAKLTIEFDGFKAAALDTLKAEAIGRASDVLFTAGIALVTGVQGEGISALNWIMTGRYGKTNPGQAGRSAVAGATSLQLAANGRQLRLLGAPIDVRTVNTGPRQMSLIGVPQATDPLENFALIAASIGKDQRFLIQT
jgi:hypothetical protein